MLENGYIKLHRQLLNWEWYADNVTKSLFLHLLLTVNYEPRRWQGVNIGRGQRVTSLPVLAEELGFSIQQIRTALKHLKSTGEITDEKIVGGRIITVKKYDLFQCVTDELTGNQQAANRQLTGDQQQRKKAKKDKKAKKRGGTRARDPSHPKTPYGEFGNVFLTSEEFDRLAELLGKDTREKYILRLGTWLKNGNERADHYATMLNWAERDGAMGDKPSQRKTSYDLDKVQRMFEEGTV